jgi:hypothetical protein
MSRDGVLARVDRDLSRGHTHLAMQRLVSLTASFPEDLEIRERRAALNRQIGNFAEAGRWDFLTETVEPAEITAFEGAHPRAWDRLYLLRLRADPTETLGPLARQRLADLMEWAGRESLGQVVWTKTGPQPRYVVKGDRIGNLVADVGCVLVLLGVIAIIGLAVVGLITVHSPSSLVAYKA